MGEKPLSAALAVLIAYILLSLPLVQAAQSNFPVPKSETLVIAGKLNDSKENAQTLHHKTEYAYSQATSSWRKTTFDKPGTVVATLAGDKLGKIITCYIMSPTNFNKLVNYPRLKSGA